MHTKSGAGFKTVGLLSISLFVGLLLVTAFPQHKASADTAAPDAKATYGKYCSLCHGNSGQGAMAPGFKTLKDNDATLAAAIANGDKKGMPAFGKKLSPDQITGLVAYIHTFSKK